MITSRFARLDDGDILPAADIGDNCGAAVGEVVDGMVMLKVFLAALTVPLKVGGLRCSV